MSETAVSLFASLRDGLLLEAVENIEVTEPLAISRPLILRTGSGDFERIAFQPLAQLQLVIDPARNTADTTSLLNGSIIAESERILLPSSIVVQYNDVPDSFDVDQTYRVIDVTASEGVALFLDDGFVFSAPDGLTRFLEFFSGVVSVQGIPDGLSADLVVTPTLGSFGDIEQLTVDLIVVPEPATAVLVLIGLAGLTRRRR
ncbi:MAG: PEP-CTERM sorting domain-containing protein [Planctomycetota bacterium]